MIKIKNIKTILLTHYNKTISSITKLPIVKTTDETLYKIIEDGYSVSRYGDGEFSLMFGNNLAFQPNSQKLATRLREIVKSKQDKHLVCIPNVFKSVDWFEEKPKEYWIKYLIMQRRKIYSLIDFNKEYYDSMVTRLYIDRKDKSKAEGHFKKFKSLWHNKNIVIVEGEKSRLGVGNDLFDNANMIERIICPAENAFVKYEEILASLQKLDKTKLILIALGPTATVLAYDLSLLGYQALDIGHIDIEFEWFLQGAIEKIPIKYKYVNEVKGGAAVENIIDLKYEKEVIKYIG